MKDDKNLNKVLDTALGNPTTEEPKPKTKKVKAKGGEIVEQVSKRLITEDGRELLL